MTTIDVVTTDNKKAGSVDLPAVVFEAKVLPDLLHAEVRRQLAKRRAGTHSTKNRAAVAGGGSKPWRQKGTGRARQGTIRAPQWQGGGSVFGPVPRSYEHSVPKKVRRATRRVAEILDSLALSGEGVLIVIAEADEKLERSARNIPGVGVIRVAGLNVYDVLRRSKLLVTKAAVAAIEARLGSTPKPATPAPEEARPAAGAAGEVTS
jgi:large subunit ribosomal protein L4